MYSNHGQQQQQKMVRNGMDLLKRSIGNRKWVFVFELQKRAPPFGSLIKNRIVSLRIGLDGNCDLERCRHCVRWAVDARQTIWMYPVNFACFTGLMITSHVVHIMWHAVNENMKLFSIDKEHGNDSIANYKYKRNKWIKTKQATRLVNVTKMQLFLVVTQYTKHINC